jgi:hypothetical protein
MAVFEEVIIPDQVGGGGEDGLRALRLPESAVKVASRGFLRAVMFADGARR